MRFWGIGSGSFASRTLSSRNRSVFGKTRKLMGRTWSDKYYKMSFDPKIFATVRKVSLLGYTVKIKIWNNLENIIFLYRCFGKFPSGRRRWCFIGFRIWKIKRWGHDRSGDSFLLIKSIRNQATYALSSRFGDGPFPDLFFPPFNIFLHFIFTF